MEPQRPWRNRPPGCGQRYLYSVLTVLAGVLVLFFVPEDKEVATGGFASDYSFNPYHLY